MPRTGGRVYKVYAEAQAPKTNGDPGGEVQCKGLGRELKGRYLPRMGRLVLEARPNYTSLLYSTLDLTGLYNDNLVLFPVSSFTSSSLSSSSRPLGLLTKSSFLSSFFCTSVYSLVNIVTVLFVLPRNKPPPRQIASSSILRPVMCLHQQ